MGSSFLPRRAIIMGRRRSISSSSADSQQAAPQASNNEPLLMETEPSLAPNVAAAALQTATAPNPVAAPANDSLELIAADLLCPPEAPETGCPRCKLCQSRKNLVVGEGSPNAELVFVGESPGEQEDQQGRPFVGKAGQLLDRMIQAMGLQREQVYLCNVIKCHPPGNRNPEADEIAACSPFLARQLDVIRPKVVVALGKFAAQTLLQTEAPISKLRGNFFPYRNGAKLMATFHPAYLLRNPESKREAWEDLQQVAAELGIKIPKRS
ncbi:MAG: uracil-DNA glycosylase [Bdellovibrionia bacterium]